MELKILLPPDLVMALRCFVQSQTEVKSDSKPSKKLKPAMVNEDDQREADEEVDFEVAEQLEFSEDEDSETHIANGEDGDFNGDEEDFEEEKPKKKNGKAKDSDKKVEKTKALTADDVRTAAKSHAKKNGFKSTMKLLDSKFKVKDVAQLKVNQYGAVIKALSL